MKHSELLKITDDPEAYVCEQIKADTVYIDFAVPLAIPFHLSLSDKIKKTGILDFTSILALLRAGDERIELPPKVLETPIIPFDQSPI